MTISVEEVIMVTKQRSSFLVHRWILHGFSLSQWLKTVSEPLKSYKPPQCIHAYSSHNRLQNCLNIKDILFRLHPVWPVNNRDIYYVKKILNLDKMRRCGAVGSASDSWLVDTCQSWVRAPLKAPVISLNKKLTLIA